MQVPNDFFAQHRNALGNQVVIRDPVGGEFSFRLLCGGNGGLIFESVNEIVKRYGLKENHLADFYYGGRNMFTVRILDCMLNEISYGVGSSQRQPIVIDDGSSVEIGEEEAMEDVADEEGLQDVGGEFVDVVDSEEDDGMLQLSDDDEDDGIMQLSDGEEDDGVERVIHEFDKVITKSGATAGQTLVSP